jgi:hypothetical protein
VEAEFPPGVFALSIQEENEKKLSRWVGGEEFQADDRLSKS